LDLPGFGLLVLFTIASYRGKPLATPLVVGGIVAVYSFNSNPSEPATCVNLLVSVIAIAYATQIQIPMKVGRILTYPSEINSPLYLIHFPIYAAMFGRFHDLLEDHPILLYTYPACTIFVAIALYHLVDRPSRRYILKKLGDRKPLATMHITS
jgi:peptidoglycan/LPS O-acetylase OafA/YrhL